MKALFPLAALALVTAVFAGCTSPTDDDDEGGGGGGAAVTTPAPAGIPLTTAMIADLIAPYNDMPFQGGQETPEHVWKWVNDDVFIFLHFNHADPAQATELLWIGVGVKGVFCKSDQDRLGGAAAGWTHFHKQVSPTWEGGHGGNAGDSGYWLLHLGVSSFEAPAWDVVPGTDYGFMPTPAPTCPAAVPRVPSLQDTGEGALAAAEVDSLVDAFGDQPFMGGQGSPEHVAKWVNEDVFIFLHWNNANPADATQLLWYGLGIRGQFCADAQPHADFTHFHKWDSATWDGGHGGSAGDYGYWLLHAGVDTFEAPAWDVTPGVDRSFMPTPVPEC